MPDHHTAWRKGTSDELFRMYVRNHKNAGFYMLFPFLLIGCAYIFLYGAPKGVVLDLTMLCVFISGLIAAAQHAHYDKLLKLRVIQNRIVSATVIALGKALYVPGILLALFYPPETGMFYNHILGYAVIMFAMMYYTTVSATYFPLFIYDISLLLACGCGMALYNFDVQETQLMIPVLTAVACLSLLSGRQLYRNARSLVQQRYQLHLAAQQAEAASRGKMDFLAAMSHEIRTPLNGIMGMIHFMNETNLDEKQRECIGTIQNCSAALLNTLNDILDISKIEAGKFQINNVNFSLRHLIKNIHALMMQKAEQKGITAFLSISDDIPAYVCSDPNRLQQILMNLLGNSIKFTEKGYVRVSIDVRKGPSPRLRFEIKDTGIGMNPAQVKNLFQRFSQADSSISGKYGGTGLGLSISKQLIELMDGQIGVDSTPGEGSMFWFEIPLVKVQEVPVAVENSANLKFAHESWVLVAEDNHINQIILTRLLEKYHIHCDIASDGREVVDMAWRNPDKYKLILMDMQMPHMDGVEATRGIRRLGDKWQRLPIIGLTGNVLDQHIQQCLDAGMVDHISKPIDPKILYQKLHPYLKASDDATAPVMDPAQPLSTIEELRIVMGDDYTRKFIDNAHTEIHKLYNNIASAFSKRNIEIIRRNAHEMKSVSGSIGLYGVMSASEMLEMLSANGDNDDIGACIVDLGDALAEIRKAA